MLVTVPYISQTYNLNLNSQFFQIHFYKCENAGNLGNPAKAFMYSIIEAGIENMGAILINDRYEKLTIKWKASQLVAHFRRTLSRN